MEGDAVLDIDAVEYQSKPHDVTFFPPNMSHRFCNLSKPEPMKILWIYAASDAARTLTASGEARLVSAEHGK